MVRKHLDAARALQAELGRPLKLMEVCGTHTVSAFRTGLRSLLPDGVALISGPGCPVCVTPDRYIDAAIALARRPGTVVATFGDMIRVPGTESSLQHARAAGGSVRIVYSPLDALQLAREHPGDQIVFLGVGFETTVPTVAWTIKQARDEGLANYSVLCSHKTMPRPMAALAESDELDIDGFLCPGHVSTVVGARTFEFLARDLGVPCVVAGFEAEDMARGIEMLVRQVAQGRAEVEIEYTRCVTWDGNPAAQAVIDEVFEPADSEWRGLGVIPGSGLAARDAFADHDAARRFTDLDLPEPVEKKGCICAGVLRGAKTPRDCKLFGTTCTPADPYGPCMVSVEGTCAAWYKYARHDAP